MIHTQPTIATLEEMDLHNPPRQWPEYMLAPLPADERVWRSDNHYNAYLIKNPWGGVNPLAALARAMQNVDWEDQMATDKFRPSLTHVQARYQDLFVQWRDAEVMRRRAMRTSTRTRK